MFDQIRMKMDDLLRQVGCIAPMLDGQAVAFLGDADCASLLLGLAATRGRPAPSAVLMLDFDGRLVLRAQQFAVEHGFGHLFEARLYNVFDPVPSDLIGQYDWFYINPPYGGSNQGESARLFLARGIELVDPTYGQACAILPSDPSRTWAGQAWTRTQEFLRIHRWSVEDRVDDVHGYHLDDDPDLLSSLMIIRAGGGNVVELPWSGRRVDPTEIANFYGRSVELPYPRYIQSNGEFDYDWQDS